MRWRALAWLVLAVLLCYTNALWGDFQFDDYKVIVDNPDVHSWQAWSALAGGGIRPLLKLSYTLNWTSGVGALGFHLVNLAIHLGNAWLVYLLADAFLRAQKMQQCMPLVPHVPLVTALLFAIHPAHTEAVSYICGRSTSLMALFYLGGVLAYVVGGERKSRWQLYGLTPLLFVAALSVKETAVTFPLLLLTWDLACKRDWKSAWRKQWPNWLVLLLGATYFLLSDRYLAHMQRSAELNSLQGNAATQVQAFAYLMRQWAWPAWLNIDPDLALRQDFSGQGWPLAMLGTLGVLTAACWRRRPWISFALMWAMLQLIPLYLFLPRLDIANDRQLYLADWPLLFALAVELAVWLSVPLFKASVTALGLVLAGLTVSRNQDYATEISLWEATVIQSPHKARVHNNLGYAYLLANRKAEARREFETALALDPEHIKARYNLERANAL